MRGFMAFSIENIARIYNDDSGTYLEVRPDADALGMLEIQYVDPQRPKDHKEARLTMSRVEAKMLIEAIENVLAKNTNID